MEQKIVSLSFSKLLKLEVREVALEVLRIIETHDPELLEIKPMYDVFLAQKPKMTALSVPFKGHPATIILKRLRRERNVHVNSIKFELKKAIALDPTGDDKTVVLLQNEINRFLEDFYSSENDSIRNSKLNIFIDEIDNNEPLAEAMQSLGFITLLNNLKLNLTDIVAQINIRTKSKSKRPKIKTDVLRKQVVKAVSNMLNEVYLAQFKNPELDYAPLFDELNEKLREIDWLVSIRLANNAKKAAERKAAKGGASSNGSGTPTTETTSTEVQTTVAGSDNGYHPSQVYVASIKKMDNPLAGQKSSIESGNGSLESEDQKKAVASSWGTKQQPSDSDKA
jgi:hypothetical protein